VARNSLRRSHRDSITERPAQIRTGGLQINPSKAQVTRIVENENFKGKTGGVDSIRRGGCFDITFPFRVDYEECVTFFAIFYVFVIKKNVYI